MVGNPEVNYLQNLLATRSESQEGLLSRKLTVQFLCRKASGQSRRKISISRKYRISKISIHSGIWFGTRWSEVQILSPRPIISKRCRVVGKSPETRVSHVFPFKASFRGETFIY
jgi:hypothetical protein